MTGLSMARWPECLVDCIDAIEAIERMVAAANGKRTTRLLTARNVLDTLAYVATHHTSGAVTLKAVETAQVPDRMRSPGEGTCLLIVRVDGAIALDVQALPLRRVPTFPRPANVARGPWAQLAPWAPSERRDARLRRWAHDAPLRLMSGVVVLPRGSAAREVLGDT